MHIWRLITHTKIKTCVPHHQNHSKAIARKTIRAVPRRATFRVLPRPYLSPDEIVYLEGIRSSLLTRTR